MTEHFQRRFGDVDFPQDLTAEPETLFASLDPQLDAMLALFAAAINAELSDAWALACKNTALANSDPVQDTLWVQPTKASLRAQKLGFPLLSLARVSSTHEELSLAKEQVTTTWAMDYLLGPLSGADYRRLGAALGAAQKAIQLTVRELGHPNYQSGARQFEGFNTIRIVSSVMGPASFAEDGEGLEFFGLHVDLETTETDKVLDGSVGDYHGATYDFGLGDSQDVLPDSVIAITDL